jgi:hypothetical protein
MLMTAAHGAAPDMAVTDRDADVTIKMRSRRDALFAPTSGVFGTAGLSGVSAFATLLVSGVRGCAAVTMVESCSSAASSRTGYCRSLAVSSGFLANGEEAGAPVLFGTFGRSGVSAFATAKT